MLQFARITRRNGSLLNNINSRINLAQKSFSNSRYVQPRDSSLHSEDSALGFKKVTVGSYLAQRLVEAGVKDYFTVPGDFTLTLLDEFLKNTELAMTNCCNELNAGYAADGYCRATGGMGVVCVTYMVGGLSVINAAAGAYSDDLPLLVISGGPNYRDEFEHHIIHHTIGEHEIYQSSKCFAPVVAKTFIVRHITDVPVMIDEAIVTCLSQRKPVYLEIACNLTSQQVPAPTPRVLDISVLTAPFSDQITLLAAIEDLKQCINRAVKPVLVAGVKLRATDSTGPFLELANALGCGVGVMPDAKGLFPEDHELYMGCYWGSVSARHCAEIVESADLYIFAGPIFNDYTTTGWSTLIRPEKLIVLGRDYVDIGGRRYSGIHLRDILSRLASESLPTKDSSIVAYKRYVAESPSPVPSVEPSASPLTLAEFMYFAQDVLTPETELVVETGDSWFIGQKMKLPTGAKYHVQMQYGSIGWSVGSTLGVGIAVGDERNVVAFIGDGSFQMTAQELSTMIRRNINVTIFLLNNNGYTIEVQIHDNAYNDIQNWDYVGLLNVFKNDGNNCHSYKAATSAELKEAIQNANDHKGVTLIECMLDRYDCTGTLLEWGSRVATSNGRA